jgi:hypothetical protein
MPRIDPNLAIGGLAARELQARGARAGERLVCPDPDILAAYADDELSGEERDTLDAHLATCASCRRTVALMVPADEPRAEPAAILRPVFRVDWKWLSMAAMVVLAAGLWYVVQTDLRSPVHQEARSRPAEYDPPAPATPPPAGPRADASPAQPAAGVVGGAAGGAPPVGSGPRPAPADAVSAKAATPSGLRDEKSSDEAKEAAKQADNRALAALRQQQEKLEKRGEPNPVTVAQQTAAAGPSQAQAPSPPQTAANEVARAPTAEETARSREAAQPPAPAPTAAPPATVTAETQRAAAAAYDKASAAARARSAVAFPASNLVGAVFADPQFRVLWRIAGGDRIETSTDGTNWTERHREPAGGLGVGTAPSTGVAWAAGARGLVLRYVAPGPWTRVSRPIEDTIVSITASSADVARVRTVSGLQFETRDAGTTWTRVP